jgi:hypothetical protein
MLLLLGLCLLCFAGGLQSSVALQDWLSGRSYWIDTLKSASLLLGAVVVFSVLSQAISKVISKAVSK